MLPDRTYHETKVDRQAGTPGTTRQNTENHMEERETYGCNHQIPAWTCEYPNEGLLNPPRPHRLVRINLVRRYRVLDMQETYPGRRD